MLDLMPIRAELTATYDLAPLIDAVEATRHIWAKATRVD